MSEKVGIESRPVKKLYLGKGHGTVEYNLKEKKITIVLASFSQASDRQKYNKYRAGTSDATTPSSFIVPLTTITVDYFSFSKTAHRCTIQGLG